MRNTKQYMSLPYNPALKEWAKALRRAGNKTILGVLVFYSFYSNDNAKAKIMVIYFRMLRTGARTASQER